MKTNKHYFAIGLFVLLSCAILALACILFGSGKLFARKLYFETYFPTSVEGLSIGSQVKFRGIPLGTVESITFAGAAYDDAIVTDTADHDTVKTAAYVRVLCAIDIEQHSNVREDRLQTMIAHGLRAKLTSAGITGGAFIALDFERDEALAASQALTFPWTPQYLYVPSVPSTLENVMNVVDALADQLKTIDFSRTNDAMTRLVETIDTSIKEANVGELSASINTVLKQLSTELSTLQSFLTEIDGKALATDVQTISANLTQLSTDLRTGLPQLTTAATTTMTQMDSALQHAANLLQQTSQTLSTVQASVNPELLGADIEETLNTLTRTTASLEALVQELRAKPSRILFDDPLR